MPGLAGKTLDQYRLIEQVGKGGMATVYRAIDERRKREVAVKVLSPTISQDKRFVIRFRREAELVSRLRHPSIVPVVGYGEARGMIYLAMPFIRGETLQHWLSHKKITDEHRKRWINQIGEALDFAHRKGVIHRDIKPSNVIITEAGNAVLTDFGLARLVEGSNTLTGSMLLGTPAYMAPEQGRGEPVDARSDQYSFGVILYQITTGQLPFDADSPMATILLHIQEPIPLPSLFVADLNPAVERVILKCLAKAPEDRFPSVRALCSAYTAALEGRFDPGQRTYAIEEQIPFRTQRPYVEATPVPPRKRLLTPWWLLVGIVPALVIGAGLAYPHLFRDSETTPLPPPPTIGVTEVVFPTQPAPISTPTPMTAISSVDCSKVLLYGIASQGNSVDWWLDNASTYPIEILDVNNFSFPAGNRQLEKIELGEKTLFEGSALEGTLQWIEGVERVVPAGGYYQFRITFANKAAKTGYGFDLVLGNANSGESLCTIRGEW